MHVQILEPAEHVIAARMAVENGIAVFSELIHIVFVIRKHPAVDIVLLEKLWFR